MMLHELLGAVAATGALPSSQLANYKTSLGYLARALQYPNAQHCPQEVFARSQEALRDALDTYLGSLQPPPSSHTVRNTRYNIHNLFTKAYEARILQPPGHLPIVVPNITSQRQASAYTSPYKRHYRPRKQPYRLSRAHWPSNIQTFWDQYVTDTRFTLRPATHVSRAYCLQSYLGYFHNIAHQPVTSVDDLFNVDLLKVFVRWHSDCIGVRCSAHAAQLCREFSAIASTLNHAHAPALRAYIRSLPPPEPMHNKQQHWLSRNELERVALSELHDAHKAVQQNPRAIHAGCKRASQHRRALMLRLLLRIPLRQRNIREMQLHRNLYQDSQGHWWLAFKGEELKIGHRKGKTNTFTVDLTTYCPDIIDHLEVYLSHFRPRFPNASTSPYVFLTHRGAPFTSTSLRQDFASLVLKRTGKRCYPHLLRTIWVSEFFTQGGTISTAAYMLNDTPGTALQRYYEFMDTNHLQEARKFNQNLGK